MSPRPLPEHAYALFEAKGPENAARVRRVVRLVAAACGRPRDWSGLRVLDLGCGEGLFALEAALHGATVTAIDGRGERMAAGRALGQELELDVSFVQADVSTYRFEEHGPFDVVLYLGLLYHLDAPALFEVTRRAAAATTRAMIVETHFASCPDRVVRHGGDSYHGWTYREHGAGESPEIRAGRVRASLANESSLWLTPQSLLALLRRAGFPTVLECHVPLQPLAAPDRFTLLALKGDAPEVVTYPWIHSLGEEAIRERIRSWPQLPFVPPSGSPRERTVTDIVITLGVWVRAHPGLVLATHQAAMRGDGPTRVADVAVWRQVDLDARIGGLGRVAPILAVEVAAIGDTLAALAAKAERYLEMGVGMVWGVLPEAREVVVFERSRQESFGVGHALPGPPGVAGPGPRVSEMFYGSS